eukprot:m51a1_g8027 putative udp-xylose and udp-n-acetylglucosamine transporter (396) ;mRNA; r:20224-21575
MAGSGSSGRGAGAVQVDVPRALRALGMIFAGCCCNVVFLEYIHNNDKTSGVFLTLAQFAFVSAVGFFQHFDFAAMRMKKRLASATVYWTYSAIFFSVSTLNNAALGYSVPLPLHQIFRSGSLVSSLVLGYLVLGRRYSLRQTLSVVAVTAGLYLATSASVSNNTAAARATGSAGGMLVGIAMLSAALVLSSLLGIYQEHVYRSAGGDVASEIQFFSHACSLVFFLPWAGDVVPRLRSWSRMALVSVPGTGGWQVSMMFAYLLGNLATQQLCITGVFEMTAAAGSLAMTLAITLRKFVTVVLSIAWFGNPFTPRHWAATCLVFLGSLAYSWPSSSSSASAAPRKPCPSAAAATAAAPTAAAAAAASPAAAPDAPVAAAAASAAEPKASGLRERRRK